MHTNLRLQQQNIRFFFRKIIILLIFMIMQMMLNNVLPSNHRTKLDFNWIQYHFLWTQGTNMDLGLWPHSVLVSCFHKNLYLSLQKVVIVFCFMQLTNHMLWCRHCSTYKIINETKFNTMYKVHTKSDIMITILLCHTQMCFECSWC